MIERCTKKRMLISIVLLIGLSIAIVLLEHHLTQSNPHPHSIQQQGGLVGNVSTTSKCWLSEENKVTEQCHPCTEFEKTSKSISACEPTGFKEKVQCNKSGTTFRSCQRVVWLEEKRFWTLEIVSLILGLTSSVFVVYRQRMLERQTMQKIEQQINMSP